MKRLSEAIVLGCWVFSVSCGGAEERPKGVDLGQGGTAHQGGSGAAGTGATGGAGGAGGVTGGTGGAGGVTPTQVFDPEAVHLFAHLDETGCAAAVVSVTDFEAIEGGFPCESAPLLLRPTDGALLYQSGAVLRLWEPDFIAQGYPPEPETNDIPFAAPAGCEPSGAWFRGEEPYFACGAPTVVHTRSGPVELGGDALLAAHRGGRLLTGSGAQLRLRLDDAVLPVEVGGLPLDVSELHHVRAVDDAFLMLRTPSGARPGALLRVGFDGTLVSLGDYGAVAGVTDVTQCRLTPDSLAVCLVTLGATRGVARFSREAAGEVLFTEAAGAGLQLSGAALFSGP